MTIPHEIRKGFGSFRPPEIRGQKIWGTNKHQLAPTGPQKGKETRSQPPFFRGELLNLGVRTVLNSNTFKNISYITKMIIHPRKHNMTNLKIPPFSIGNRSSTGGFSIAMLVYQRVDFMGIPKISPFQTKNQVIQTYESALKHRGIPNHLGP